MKKSRHTPEQIVRKLREAEAKLASGTSVPEVPESRGSAKPPSIAGRTATAACRRTP